MGHGNQPEANKVLFTACVIGCNTCPNGRMYLATQEAGYAACAELLANAGVPGAVLQSEEDSRDGHQSTAGLEASAAICQGAEVCPFGDRLPGLANAIKRSMQSTVGVVVERATIVRES